ncbi:MAG TPA: hypothetical protein VFI92_00555 [Steroidobacteraceae bacterium]|nr:hypothetical protein [Steroidobacteraceae bacterium]
MNPSVRPVMVLIALAVLPCSAVRAETAAAAPAAPVDAVWVELKRNLVYFGQTTYYSCYGLRDKVRYILQQAGARPDLKVWTSCVESGGAGVEAMPSVRIRAAFPTEATPEVLARLEAEAPKRELVARVKGTGDRGDAETAQFPAVWRRVEFDGSGRGRIEDGDCELLEHVLEQVLVPAGVRVAPGSRLGCMRGQLPTGSVRLMVDTLQKAPKPDEGPADR